MIDKILINFLSLFRRAFYPNIIYTNIRIKFILTIGYYFVNNILNLLFEKILVSYYP